MQTTIIETLMKSFCYCSAAAAVSVSVSLLTQKHMLWTEVEAQQADFSNEKIVHLLEEPRHRTVHQEGNLYLLDVQVNPGDISYAHLHDQPILLTSISSGSGPSNGNVRAIPEY